MTEINGIKQKLKFKKLTIMKNLQSTNNKREFSFKTAKWIKGYEDLYMIDEQGIVISFHYSKPRQITPIVTPQTGYYMINLIDKNGVQKIKKYHRLVAETFIPNPENKRCVNHKDGDKLNNLKTNLEWNTYKENTQHALMTGLIKTGQDSPNAKLNNELVKNIVTLAKEGKKYSEIINELELDIHTTTVSNIVNNRTWTHVTSKLNTFKNENI